MRPSLEFLLRRRKRDAVNPECFLTRMPPSERCNEQESLRKALLSKDAR